MGMYNDQIPTSSGVIPNCHTQTTGWIQTFHSHQPVPWSYPLPPPPLPPPTTALENATNFCHLLRDVEEDQALLLKREDGQQVTLTGTLKLAAHHTSLLGERARLHTLHLQVPTPTPAALNSPGGGRPIACRLTGRSVKAIPVGRKGQASMIR